MDISLRRLPDGWIAATGFALVFAPLLFVTIAVLESLGAAYLSSYVDFFASDPLGPQLSNIFWPALFLGGLAFALAQIHRRDDYAAAERAIGAREGDGPGTIWGRGGPVSVFSCRGETL